MVSYAVASLGLGRISILRNMSVFLCDLCCVAWYQHSCYVRGDYTGYIFSTLKGVLGVEMMVLDRRAAAGLLISRGDRKTRDMQSNTR